MSPHRRLGARAPPYGRTARLCRRRAVRRLAALHRRNPERAGARIRPEPERLARRVAERADPDRERWDHQSARTPWAWHRARPQRRRALPHRMSVSLLYTIGYEKALLQDVVSMVAAARVATLIDVRDRPISR